MRFNFFKPDSKIFRPIFVENLRRKASSALKSLSFAPSKKKTALAILGLGLGSYGYQQFISNKLEVIYTPNDFTNEMIESIKSLKGGRYWGSPYLFLRCMEIIYGNTIDSRAHVDYNREIIYTPDDENIALGLIIRLVLQKHVKSS